MFLLRLQKRLISGPKQVSGLLPAHVLEFSLHLLNQSLSLYLCSHITLYYDVDLNFVEDEFRHNNRLAVWP